MSAFDKNRSAPSSESSPGSVFDRKPAANSPGSVFDQKPNNPPGPSSVFTNNSLPTQYTKQKGVKYGAPVWSGPVALKPAKKGSAKQSKTLLMMQQMIDDGDGASVPNAFNQEKGDERSKYQRVEGQTTVDRQLYGTTGSEGLENSRFDPFREEYGPSLPPQSSSSSGSVFGRKPAANSSGSVFDRKPAK